MTRPVTFGALGACLLCLLTSASAPTSASTSAQQPTFRGRSDLVRVFVTVMDRDGRLVTTLAQNDFEVRDDGKPQPITTFDNSPLPIRLIVMLDVSGSMVGNLPLLHAASQQLFARLRPEDAARVGTFGNDVEISPAFTKNPRELREALPETISPDAPTPLWRGMYAALDAFKGGNRRGDSGDGGNGRTGAGAGAGGGTSRDAGRGSDRDEFERRVNERRGNAGTRQADSTSDGPGTAPADGDVRDVILVLSDGKDSGPIGIRERFVSQAEIIDRARNESVMIYAIGMRSRSGRPMQQPGIGPGALGQMLTADLPDPGLARVAEETGGGYAEIRYGEDLSAAFARVADELHSQYLLGYTPPKRDGKVHDIDVRLTNQRGLKPRARKDYVAPKD